MKTFKREIEITLDPRKKGGPYVARLRLGPNGIEREFYSLQRFYGRKQVTLSGEIEYSPGDIIETREGASWKNDYRFIYLVKEDGNWQCLGRATEAKTKKKVYEILKSAGN